MSLKETLSRARLVQDGAMGTQLEALVPEGHPLSVKGLPLWSTKVLLGEPSWVTDIHRKYVAAGCDMLITASYQASQQTLLKHENMDLEAARAVWQQSVDCARQATEAENEATKSDVKASDKKDGRKKVWIAASVGPYGAYLANGAEYSGDYAGLSEQELAEYHREQVRFFVENSDVDVIAFETVPNFAEVRALFGLLHSMYSEGYRKEFYMSLSCKNATTLADGTPIETVVEYMLAQKGVVGECFVAAGCNCVAYELVAPFIKTVRSVCEQHGVSLPLVVYPNLGFDNDMSDTSQYAFKSSNDGWAQAVREWLTEPSVRVVGGCCSTGPAEVAVIRDAIDY